MPVRRLALASAAGAVLAFVVQLLLHLALSERSSPRGGRWTAPGAAAAGPARHQLVRLAGGTYLEAMIAGHDPKLQRWSGRGGEPVRVWIGPADSLPDWRPELPGLAREAFGEWARSGVPLWFAFVADSAAAEVHVRWVDQLPGVRDGFIVRSLDRRGRMYGAEITLSLRATGGAPHSDRVVRALALHEVGHLLGLEHSPESSDVMAASVSVDALSDRDRATARLLYALPVGRVR
ncbi:MAG TPA: matrixin family metalloprotease [Gemmatimonadaceae bacterium]|nr:matrixin family metalloprotease [Gemmatimonadaceae bacterium]